MPKLLPDTEFLEMVDKMPLVSIDLIIIDSKGRILLGLRANEPAKGTWYFPGGRIFKGEMIQSAGSRIAFEEVGLGAKKDARFVGVNEWFFDTNFYGAENIGTHYVALAFMVRAEPEEITISVTDKQHRARAWMTIEEIKKNPEVSPDVVHAINELEAKKYLPQPV